MRLLGWRVAERRLLRSAVGVNGKILSARCVTEFRLRVCPDY